VSARAWAGGAERRIARGAASGVLLVLVLGALQLAFGG